MEKGIEQALTSAEISQLWGTHLGDSSQACILTYFHNSVEDEEVKTVIDYALESAASHVKTINGMFTADGHEAPKGFSVQDDVETSAPKVFSDDFMLEFLYQFAKIGLRAHATNVSLAVREDCTELFKKCLEESVTLYEKTKNLLIKKGLYVTSPAMHQKHKVDFIHHKNFLAGFFGDKRPLNAPEVTNLFTNFQRNALGAAALLGFSQMAKSKDVVKHLLKGKEIAEKHCEIFNSLLQKNDLPAGLYWDSQVNEHSYHVFSDKLLVYITSSLTSAGVAFYGLSIGVGMRSDLSATYNRLLAEVQTYAKDGADITINHGWFEAPPEVKDI